MIHPLEPAMPKRLSIALALLLAGCGGAGEPGFQGYVEGEYLYLAAPLGGYLKSLDAPRGNRVAEGQTLFVIAPEPDLQALAEAEAKAGSAREKLENLKEPRRQPEIAALEANLRAAEAGQRLTRTRLNQQQALAQQGFISQDKLDEARSAQDQALAQVEAARQQLATYRATLGRKAEVRGAEAELQAASALTAQRRWALEHKTLAAPAAGEISETYYQPGEWVPAGAPVLSLLPDSRRRLRFFVPERVLSSLKPGQAVTASCDGCNAPIRGRIDFIAPQAEYTPPVIYSRDSREKLVFRVEATVPPEQAAALRPGLPVDVGLAGD
ncbi:MAG: secretion protein HlyD [Gammaproteobacteria bacterium RIFOXYA12_FULL_61_12]|nr:MAG: secretion protein HlyD [Gammaproteobacteria bacterium RIFOXYA12_FULL_61_12]OGT90982.1 MAG: secretion protein HlyD [Gammaproteobacteria bacterium RIFOXYD12_FULL_61_37]